MSHLTATYAAQSSVDSPWLNIAQVPVPKIAQAANLADVAEMYIMARSGLSAMLYQADRCPATVDGETVTCHLQVDVFPSAVDLPYKLEALPGVVGPAVAVRAPREFDLVIPMADRVELDFLADEIEILEETDWYSPLGETILRPEVSVAGNLLSLSQKCFSVIRLRCVAIGYRHAVDISVTRQTGYKIENFACAVQATWMDNGELRSDSRDLDIPECVEALLATCPGDGDLVGTGRSRRRNSGQPVVWYNHCSGEIVKVEYPDGEGDQ